MKFLQKLRYMIIDFRLRRKLKEMSQNEREELMRTTIATLKVIRDTAETETAYKHLDNIIWDCEQRLSRATNSYK